MPASIVPTDEQMRVLEKIQEHAGAQNWQAVSDMQQEALLHASVMRTSMPDMAEAICSCVSYCYDYSLGQYDKAIKLNEQRLTMAEEVGDRAGYAHVCVNLGLCYEGIRNFEKALKFLEQARTISEEVRDRPGLGHACHGIAICYDSLGRFNEAIELFEQDLAIATEVSDLAGQGSSRVGLGRCYRSLGQYDMAIKLHEQALAIAENMDDRYGKAWAYCNIGFCFELLGQHDRAIRLFERALAIAEDTGDAGLLMGANGGLGRCYCSLSHLNKAIMLHKQHLALAQSLGDRTVQSNGDIALDTCYQSLGLYENSIKLRDQALASLAVPDLAISEGGRAGRGLACENPARLYETHGHFDKAISAYEQDLEIAKEMCDRAGEGSTWRGLSRCYRSLGQFDKSINLLVEKAIKFHERRLAMAKEVGCIASQGRACGNMGLCHDVLGQHMEAIKLHQQHLAFAEKGRDRPAQGHACGNLANSYQSLGQYGKAIELYLQDLTIAEEIGNRTRQGTASSGLGHALSQKGDGKAAACALVRALAAYHSVEQDAGAHDDRRVSVFEQQEAAYRLLQGVLLEQAGQSRWALGVAEVTKARALAHRIGGRCRSITHQATFDYRSLHWKLISELGDRGGSIEHGSWTEVERVCGEWWAEVERLARAEGPGTCVLQYSFLFDGRLAMWVVSGATGELLSSRVVPSTGLGGSKGRRIEQVLAETRASMGVRGRDAMREACDSFRGSTSYTGEAGERLDSSPRDSTEEAPPSLRHFAKEEELKVWQRKKVMSAREQLSRLMVEIVDLCVKIKEDVDGEHGQSIHQGVRCDACEMFPILGKRCKCAVCKDYNVCEKCYLGDKHSGPASRHTFFLLQRPGAAWTVSHQDLYSSVKDKTCMDWEMIVNGLLQQAQTESQKEKLEKDNSLESKDLEELEQELRNLIEKLTKVEHVLRAQQESSKVMVRIKLFLDEVELMVKDKECLGMILQETYTRYTNFIEKLRQDVVKDEKEEFMKQLKEAAQVLMNTVQKLQDQLCQILLKELYEVLIAPVASELEAAEELLIVPHMELSEVPWAALTDADGRYLIERYVIRTAPSLRVARQLADRLHDQGSREKGGRALVVGNPWPNSAGRLEYAEREAQTVSRMLCEERFQVSLHVTIGATKLRVSQDLKGVDWAHFSCHADKDTQSLLLATPHVSTIGVDKWALMKSLSMKDVETEVEMGVGSTAVLSACDTGLGEIKPEGVMGLARGFLSAGASATVVSLWSVDDGSTALLMEHMYTEMAQEGQALGLKWKEAGSEKPCTGTEIKNDLLAAVLQKQVEFKNEEWQIFQVGDLCSNSYIKAGDRYFKPADAQVKTVAQALRASMLRLARCRAADGQAEAWKRPYYWAGFVVVGATTRLRLPSTQAAS